MSRYVDVVISRETKPVSEQGFGMPLVLATSKELAYKEYTDISEVTEDFAENTAEYKLLSRMFGQNPVPNKIACYGIVYDSEIDEPTKLSAALNQLIKKHNDFYYIVSTEQGENEIIELSNWTSTQEKLYGVTTSNVAIAEALKGKYDNTFIVIHDQPEMYVAEGLIAAVASYDIGSYTWTFKTVRGLPTIPAVEFEESVINQIHNSNASTYISEGGLLINSHGVVTSGEYIDVIQATHYLKARITEAVFRLLATKKKVAYTDRGISLVVAEVEKVLAANVEDETTGEGIIARDEAGNPLYSVTIPKKSDIPKNTIAKRILPDIPWEAEISGAIETVKIRGVLKV